MQIIRNSDLSTKFNQNVEVLWDELSKGLADVGSKKLREFPASDVDRLNVDVLQATKVAMSKDAAVLASEPSRYLLAAMEEYLRQAAHFKRELATKKPSWLPSDYDMEEDIRDTEALARAQMKNQFQCETAYWKAMDEKRYDDAKVVLNATRLMRANSESIMQIEVINWQLELSSRMGDMESFVSALADADGYGVLVNADATNRMVEQLLSARGFNELKVALTPEGHRQAGNAPEGVVQFMHGHLTIFIKSMVNQITDGVLKDVKMPVTEFRGLINKAASDSRRSFLAVSPLVQDVIVPQF